MRTTHPPHIAPLAILLAALPACRSPEGRDERAKRAVEPDAFVLADRQPPPVVVPPTREPPASTPDPEVRREPPALRVRPGPPVALDDAGAPVEEPTLLDAKVGDINGRPIFASEFLRPISGRLRAEAERLGRDQWIQTAAQMIREELRALITDELLRGEALGRLTVEQKAGLRRFLQDFRRDLISQAGGSISAAERRLEREQGLTAEEYLQQQEERTLVRLTVQEQISSRVNVSWRDIVQRYRRDQDKYNPNPVARFWILRIDAGDEAALERVRGALEAGTPFPEVAASDVNTWTLDEQGLKEAVFAPPREEATFFGVPELNEPARTLDEGETTGPIEFAGSLIWLHLASVEQRTIPLYDAQLPIANAIRQERFDEELNRYIDRLLGRASVTDVDKMGLRLLAIATERYAPARERPGLETP